MNIEFIQHTGIASVTNRKEVIQKSTDFHNMCGTFYDFWDENDE